MHSLFALIQACLAGLCVRPEGTNGTASYALFSASRALATSLLWQWIPMLL